MDEPVDKTPPRLIAVPRQQDEFPAPLEGATKALFTMDEFALGCEYHRIRSIQQPMTSHSPPPLHSSSNSTNVRNNAFTGWSADDKAPSRSPRYMKIDPAPSDLIGIGPESPTLISSPTGVLVISTGLSPTKIPRRESFDCSSPSSSSSPSPTFKFPPPPAIPLMHASSTIDSSEAGEPSSQSTFLGRTMRPFYTATSSVTSNSNETQELSAPGFDGAGVPGHSKKSSGRQVLGGGERNVGSFAKQCNPASCYYYSDCSSSNDEGAVRCKRAAAALGSSADDDAAAGIEEGASRGYDEVEQIPKGSVSVRGQKSLTSAAHQSSPLPREDSRSYLILRTACNECTQRKVRCDGAKPCLGCRRKGVTCTFSASQKQGKRPSLRKVGDIPNTGGRALLDLSKRVGSSLKSRMPAGFACGSTTSCSSSIFGAGAMRRCAALSRSSRGNGRGFRGGTRGRARGGAIIRGRSAVAVKRGGKSGKDCRRAGGGGGGGRGGRGKNDVKRCRFTEPGEPAVRSDRCRHGLTRRPQSAQRQALMASLGFLETSSDDSDEEEEQGKGMGKDMATRRGARCAATDVAWSVSAPEQKGCGKDNPDDKACETPFKGPSSKADAPITTRVNGFSRGKDKVDGHKLGDGGGKEEKEDENGAEVGDGPRVEVDGVVREKGDGGKERIGNEAGNGIAYRIGDIIGDGTGGGTGTCSKGGGTGSAGGGKMFEPVAISAALAADDIDDGNCDDAGNGDGDDDDDADGDDDGDDNRDGDGDDDDDSDDDGEDDDGNQNGDGDDDDDVNDDDHDDGNDDANCNKDDDDHDSEAGYGDDDSDCENLGGSSKDVGSSKDGGNAKNRGSGGDDRGNERGSGDMNLEMHTSMGMDRSMAMEKKLEQYQVHEEEDSEGKRSGRAGPGDPNSSFYMFGEAARASRPSRKKETKKVWSQLRKACDRCTSKKVKCDGKVGCFQCKRVRATCHFSICRRSGPRDANGHKKIGPVGPIIPRDGYERVSMRSGDCRTSTPCRFAFAGGRSKTEHYHCRSPLCEYSCKTMEKLMEHKRDQHPEPAWINEAMVRKVAARKGKEQHQHLHHHQQRQQLQQRQHQQRQRRRQQQLSQHHQQWHNTPESSSWRSNLFVMQRPSGFLSETDD